MLMVPSTRGFVGAVPAPPYPYFIGQTVTKTNTTLALPSGVQTGDLLFYIMQSTGGFISPSPPGWTSLYSDTYSAIGYCTSYNSGAVTLPTFTGVPGSSIVLGVVFGYRNLQSPSPWEVYQGKTGFPLANSGSGGVAAAQNVNGLNRTVINFSSFMMNSSFGSPGTASFSGPGFADRGAQTVAGFDGSKGLYWYMFIDVQDLQVSGYGLSSQYCSLNISTSQPSSVQATNVAVSVCVVP